MTRGEITTGEVLRHMVGDRRVRFFEQALANMFGTLAAAGVILLVGVVGGAFDDVPSFLIALVVGLLIGFVSASIGVAISLIRDFKRGYQAGYSEAIEERVEERVEQWKSGTMRTPEGPSEPDW